MGTPPGLVSLHLISSPVLSPPQRHLSTPLTAHFVGEITPQHDPTRFLQAIRRTFRTYQESAAAARAPLLVNTAGWLTGLGAELLLEMRDVINPGIIIHLRRPTESDAASAE